LPVLVTVDTEEDNWFPARDGVTNANIPGLTRLQAVLDTYKLRPTLLTSWQVARDPRAMEVVLRLREDHGAEIGAHLHPWNTPPLDEAFGPDTFGWRRLPADLQARKLARLTEALESATGARPTSFRAGRWSLGAAGASALVRAGYRTDSSVLPYLYWYNVEDSPNYHRAPPYPWRVDGRRSVEDPAPDGMVEIPPTVGFSRWPWRPWASMDRMLRSSPLRAIHAVGVLARTRVIDKLALSPEVNGAEQMVALARVALANGVPVLNVFLHSGALTPGHTPYVNSQAELHHFLGELDRFFDGLGWLVPFEGMTLGEAGELVRAGTLGSVSPAAS
jgi:peptidoglycan/xylan/chitin deacetylase (PgdA/CDA1 family)